MDLLRSIGNPTIAARFWHVAGVAAVGLLAISVTSLHVLEDRLIVERKAKVRATVELGGKTVELAHTQLAYYGALAEAGKMGREEARRAALQAVRAMRYDEREYLWINDLKPTMVMHPIKPEMDGQDLSSVADPLGNKLFVGFVDVVRMSPGGAGFYKGSSGNVWRLRGSSTASPRVTYWKAAREGLCTNH